MPLRVESVAEKVRSSRPFTGHCQRTSPWAEAATTGLGLGLVVRVGGCAGLGGFGVTCGLLGGGAALAVPGAACGGAVRRSF